MPDSIRICGELMTPPASSTSRRARTVWVPPARRYSTPTARLRSSRMRDTSARVSTVRFGRRIAGRRYATAALQRRPSRMVFWFRPMPSLLPLLRSGFHFSPAVRFAAV